MVPRGKYPRGVRVDRGKSLASPWALTHIIPKIMSNDDKRADKRKPDASTIEQELSYRAEILKKNLIASCPLVSARLIQYRKTLLRDPKRKWCPYCYITKAETEALAVESHEVIDIQSGSADGLKSFYPGMRSVPIVVVQPFGELTGSVV